MKTRYAVRLTVPRRGGWRAWGTVRAGFERALTDHGDPAIASAEIASEPRRGADYVRVTVALTVTAADVADALTIAWDAFRSAARDDLTGWESGRRRGRSPAGAAVNPNRNFFKHRYSTQGGRARRSTAQSAVSHHRAAGGEVISELARTMFR